MVYHGLGKLDLALDDCNKAVALDPDFEFDYLCRGWVYQDMGENALAIIDFAKCAVISKSPGWMKQAEQGLYEIVLKDLDNAIKLNPNDANAYRNRAFAYWGQIGRVYKNISGGEAKANEAFDLAIADYTKAIELDPNNAARYTDMLGVYTESGKSDLALVNCNKAIELEPNNANNYGSRGLTYWQMGQYDLALADYNKAIELDPNNANAYLWRGQLYDNSLGKNDLALADYNKAIELNPGGAFYYFARGSLYVEMGKNELARVDLEKCLELNQNDPWLIQIAQQALDRLK
jgi:tetratricopeptide (TPR) repeat protein